MASAGNNDRRSSAGYAMPNQGVYLVDPTPDYGLDEPTTVAAPWPTRRVTDPYESHGRQQQYHQQQYPAPTPHNPPRPSRVTNGGQRPSAINGGQRPSATAGPVVVKPPDRQQETIELNTSRATHQQFAQAKSNEKVDIITTIVIIIITILTFIECAIINRGA